MLFPTKLGLRTSEGFLACKLAAIFKLVNTLQQKALGKVEALSCILRERVCDFMIGLSQISQCSVEMHGGCHQRLPWEAYLMYSFLLQNMLKGLCPGM